MLAGCSRADYFKITPTSLTLESKGADRTVKALAMNRQGQEFPGIKPERWTSSDEKVATVDQAGKVTAVGSGNATIKAILDKIEGEVMVEVITVEKFSVEPLSVTLTEDDDAVRTVVKVLDARGKQLEKRMVTARCKDEKVCNTDKENKIWPVGPGETTAEFRCEGFSQTVKVVVEKGKKK